MRHSTCAHRRTRREDSMEDLQKDKDQGEKLRSLVEMSRKNDIPALLNAKNRAQQDVYSDPSKENLAVLERATAMLEKAMDAGQNCKNWKEALTYLKEAFGRPELKLIRCMPNTPALVLEGCTGVCAEENVTEEDMEQVLALLRSFGIASVVPERLMDVVVGVSGSSPAYVFMFIEAMADEAVAAGMPRKQAYEFAAQSVLGSARMVLETGRHPGELKDMVCSPGGTTIQAVKVLEEKGMRAAVMDAMDACIEKSKSM